jgi:hypothetical protein
MAGRQQRVRRVGTGPGDRARPRAGRGRPVGQRSADLPTTNARRRGEWVAKLWPASGAASPACEWQEP